LTRKFLHLFTEIRNLGSRYQAIQTCLGIMNPPMTLSWSRMRQFIVTDG